MIVFLSLGSNRGDRAAHLAAAVAALSRDGIHVLRVSTVKETAPVGATGRARFLNCVVEGATDLPPRVLLRRLRRIEFRLGRRHGGARAGKRLPRTVDLDLILYGRTRLKARGLSIPHPRFLQRRFVLDGLIELAATLRAPGQSRNARQAARAMGGPW